MTPRRKWLFAAITTGLALTVTAMLLIAMDVYLHHRVQNLGGVNVWGYRGPVIGAKRSNEIRIVVLGGSTAFGYGLPWTEAFPYQLQKALNARAQGGRVYTVVNLGAPGQGAYGFQFDLRDYAYLRYDSVILYEGYNDLGSTDLPEAVPPRTVQNRLLWRRQSPVYRLTGYFPVLPLVFREKAMALRAGGDLDAAYRGRVVFKPGLATRATAATLQEAAQIAETLGRSLDRVTRTSAAVLDPGSLDTVTWKAYTESVVDAVRTARARRCSVIVVTQPYASAAHMTQQNALASALRSAFGDDAGVRYVNLGLALNIRDRDVAYDGLHLRASANQVIANQLTEPVLNLAK
jgi:lysophospholipase L1-like esterase